MISTYEIEKERHELLLKNAKGEAEMQDFVDAYIKASVTAAEYKKENDALKESIAETLDKDAATAVIDEADLKVSEYDYRFVSEVDIQKLEEYGYTNPIVPVDYEEAIEYMEAGYPVFLLNHDNTESAAKLGINVERHLKAGGMIGVQQFAAEDMEVSFLESALTDDTSQEKE